jgi:4-amino-4-deoxy-L-arabinose transferase-like glycosyltransferase
MRPETSRTRLWLFVILLGSFALRLWLASIDLHAGRFFDEKINMANVAALLRGSARPANGFYQGLSYLPQTALLALSRALHRLTDWEALTVTGPRGFTPWAYFLCRLLQTIYGTLSLFGTYVLGRKLFPEGVAILGMFLLAVTPRHLHASVIFKPDILLLLWTVVAFVWILAALEHPGFRRYLLAGLGIGLCMATKLNGGLVAAPFAAGTFPLLGRIRRAWLWLVLAGVAAAAVFLLFNPILGMQVEYFGKNLEHYELRARTTRLQAFLQTLAFPFSDLFHGGLIGLAAVLGGGWMAASAVRRGWRDARGLQELVFLSYPLFYVGLYAIATTRAKQNHFLQILPFTSLLAASCLLGALSWHAGKGGRGSVLVRRTVLAALAGWLSLQMVARVYEQAVPENRARASRFLHRMMPAPRRGRLIYAEAAVSPDLAGRTFSAGGLYSVERLETVPPEVLDLADAEVFPLTTAGSSVAEGIVRFTSRPLVGRGEGVGVLLHPWALVTSSRGSVRLARGERGRWLVGALPVEAKPGEVISLGLWLPKGLGWKAELRAGGQRLPLVRLEGKRRQILYLSTRVVVKDASGEVVLRMPADGKKEGRRVDFTLYRWRRKAPETFRSPRSRQEGSPVDRSGKMER